MSKKKPITQQASDTERKAPAKCACKSPIPWHLLELGLNSHNCMCGRKWARVNDTTVKLAELDTGWRGA